MGLSKQYVPSQCRTQIYFRTVESIWAPNIIPKFLEKLCKKTLDQAGKSILSQFTIFHKIFENDSSFYVKQRPTGKV